MAVRPSLNHRPPSVRPATDNVPLPPAAVDAGPVGKARSTAEGYRPPSRQRQRAAVAGLEPAALHQRHL